MAMAQERSAPAADDVDADGDGEEELFARPKPTAAPVSTEDSPLSRKERKEMNQRIKDLEAQAAERGRESDFWAARARQQPVAVPTPQRAAPPPEPELTDEAAMEEFTRSPLVAFAKMAKKFGYVTKAEQEAYMQENLVNFGKGIMQRIGTDQKLLREFPDLADSTTDFAKRTMEILEDLTEGDQRKRTTFFKAAAKQAKLEFELTGKGGKRRTRAAAVDDDVENDDGDLGLGEDDDDETPAERQSRIARQGPKGGRSARSLESFTGGSGVMESLFEQFDIKPERRAEVIKNVKKARRSAIAENM